MKKIICSILAAILLLAPISSIPIFSVTDDGTNEELEAQGYIGISTEEELKTVTSDFYLKNDIFFTSGIGDSREGIRIHGNGHTVYFAGGMSIIESCKEVWVEDLKLAGNVIITDDSSVFSNYGPLTSYNQSLMLESEGASETSSFIVKDVHSTVNITVLDENFHGCIGGIAGDVDSGQVYDSSYTGTISIAGDVAGGQLYVGGLAGAWDSVTATNSRANAKIIVDGENIMSVGGLFGRIQQGTISNCSFGGSVTVRGNTFSNSGIGGICGTIGEFTDNCMFTNVVNDGNIKLQSDTSTASVGGIVGLVNSNNGNFSFDKVINTGNIDGVSTAGGIIGRIMGISLNGYGPKTFELTAVKNSGSITAASIAGGIIGGIDASNNVTVDQTLNEGAISATAADAQGVAGIVGKSEQMAWLTNTYNTGAVSGVNATPLLISVGYSDTNEEKLYYTNEIEGEHIGEQITPEEMAQLISQIKFATVDMSELQQLLTDFSGLLQSDYTQDSWKALLAAMAAGAAVLQNPTKQWEIDAIADNINNAIDALQLTAVAKNELEKIDEYVEECKNLYAGDYTSASWGRLQNAVLKFDDPNMIPAEKREAYAELVKAAEQLVYVRDLRIAYNKLPKNQNAYPSSAAWLVASAAIQEAEYILNKAADPTQAEVDAATDAVLKALEYLDLIENTDTDHTDITETGTDDTDIPKSDFEKIKDAWLEYLAMQGMDPPETDDANDIFPPENDEAFRLAWQEFLAQQVANSDTSGGTSGIGTAADKATMGIAVGAIVVIVAIAVGLSLKKKED